MMGGTAIIEYFTRITENATGATSFLSFFFFFFFFYIKKGLANGIQT